MSMLNWFRKGPSPYQTALAMVGVNTGDHLLVVGTPEPGLCAELGLVTGLNGATAVVAPAPEARARIEAAAGRAGALVEFAADDSSGLTADGASDTVVVAEPLVGLTPAARLERLTHAMRWLRPGGRLIVIDGTRRAGLFAGRSVPTLPADTVVALLGLVGARAARTLATVDGVAYYEAQKARDSQMRPS